MPSPLRHDRRTFLRSAVGLVSSVAAGRILAACAGATQSSEASTSPDAGGADELRVLRTTGRPDHATGDFPNPGCPIAIRERERVYYVPRFPRVAGTLTPLDFWELGLAFSGVAFDPSGPSYRGDDASGWMFENAHPAVAPHLGLDAQMAHVQPSGAYHYHAFAPVLRERASGGVVQLGWAADGFPIYGSIGHADPLDPESPLVTLRPSYRLKDGPRPTGGPGGQHDGVFVPDYAFDPEAGDLDEANGRFGVTPEFPEGTYHYVLTETFPYIPRFYVGTPHPSFAHPRGPGLQGTPPALRDYRG